MFKWFWTIFSLGAPELIRWNVFYPLFKVDQFENSGLVWGRKIFWKRNFSKTLCKADIWKRILSFSDQKRCVFKFIRTSVDWKYFIDGVFKFLRFQFIRFNVDRVLRQKERSK